MVRNLRARPKRRPPTSREALPPLRKTTRPMIHTTEHGTWATIHEAADHWGVSVTTIHRWLRTYNIRTANTYPRRLNHDDLTEVVRWCTSPPMP